MIKLIGHMVLSGLLLVTSTGMTINMHFCQGHLYDLALNAPAHSCCEPDAGETACHHHHDMTKSHQCDDKSIRIESSQDYVSSGFTFDFGDTHSFELFGTSTLLIEPADTDKPFTTRLIDYKKPPPQEVVLSQIQTYLI
jgi:hypothetical protein